MALVGMVSPLPHAGEGIRSRHRLVSWGSVDVFSVAERHNEYHKSCVLDCVDNPVIAGPYPVGRPAGQASGSGRPGVRR